MTFLERVKHLQKNHPNPDKCVDSDAAQFELGVALGLWTEDSWMENKRWCQFANPIDTMLCKMLVLMTEAAVLGGDVGAEGVWARDWKSKEWLEFFEQWKKERAINKGAKDLVSDAAAD